MEFVKQLPLYENDNVCGCVTISHSGLVCRIECVCTPADGELKRIYVTDTDGATICAGVPVNNGGCFRAYRRFTKNELAAASFTPDKASVCTLMRDKPQPDAAGEPMREETAGEADKRVSGPQSAASAPESDSEWKLCAAPADICRDQIVLAALVSADEIWMLRRGETTFLASPLVSDKPFGLNPAFTVAQPVEIHGRKCAAVMLDKNGIIMNNFHNKADNNSI